MQRMKDEEAWLYRRRGADEGTRKPGYAAEVERVRHCMRNNFKKTKKHTTHGACEIALTEVLATQMGAMRRSKKVSSFELYKLNPLSPHCGSIARELVHCYTWGRLRIVTVRGNTVGRHS